MLCIPLDQKVYIDSHLSAYVPKKNVIGFTDKQLSLLLNYCRATLNNPRIPYNKFHSKYSFYSRKQSTADLISKAYEKVVVTGPFLYCSSNLEVVLLDNINNPLKHWKEQKSNPNIPFSMALQGDWDYLAFKRGANTLDYTETPIPSFPALCTLENIYFEEEGILTRDKYPHGWDEVDWEVFGAMRRARAESYKAIGEKLGISIFAVREHYLRILNQVKTLICFFPIGFYNYQYLVVTFSTKYEIGLERALKKLDRTTYLYKSEGRVILHMQVNSGPAAMNRVIARFKELEEIGIIHDFRASIPMEWKNIYV